MADLSKYIQFGGWQDAPEGWTNFESSIHLRTRRIPVLGKVFGYFLDSFSKKGTFPLAVRYGDIVQGLPVPENYAKLVFSSHVIEHLPLDYARLALGNCYRVLEPGGTLRFVLPDFQSRANFYVRHHHSIAAPSSWIMRSTMLGQEQSLTRGLHLAKAAFSTSAHKWMWDYATLKLELEQAGFVSIRRAQFGDNPDPMLKLVERRSRFFWSPRTSDVQLGSLADLEFHELAVEASKPEASQIAGR